MMRLDMTKPVTSVDREAAGPRRRFLQMSCGVAGALAGSMLGIPGCSAPPEEPAPVRVNLSQIPIGSRIVVQWDGKPVEVLRRPQGVQVLSLLCTHMGCEVRWDRSEERYVCPCHDGRFDPVGTVVSGPPTEGLRRAPWTRDGTSIVIGG